MTTSPILTPAVIDFLHFYVDIPHPLSPTVYYLLLISINFVNNIILFGHLLCHHYSMWVNILPFPDDAVD